MLFVALLALVLVLARASDFWFSGEGNDGVVSIFMHYFYDLLEPDHFINLRTILRLQVRNRLPWRLHC